MGEDHSTRSARRTTVRARSNEAETRLAPGTTKSLGMSMRPMNTSICCSRRSTIAGVTSVVPACSFDRLDGSVVTSAINTYRSRSSPVNNWSSSDPGSTSARASPSAA